MTKIVAAVALATLALTGCKASIDTRDVKGEDLAVQVQATLAKEVGQMPEKVDCPDDLNAAEGKTVRCTLTHQGTSYGVTVTSKGADDKGDVQFAVEVDKEPTAAP